MSKNQQAARALAVEKREKLKIAAIVSWLIGYAIWIVFHWLVSLRALSPIWLYLLLWYLIVKKPRWANQAYIAFLIVSAFNILCGVAGAVILGIAVSHGRSESKLILSGVSNLLRGVHAAASLILLCKFYVKYENGEIVQQKQKDSRLPAPENLNALKKVAAVGIPIGAALWLLSWCLRLVLQPGALRGPIAWSFLSALISLAPMILYVVLWHRVVNVPQQAGRAYSDLTVFSVLLLLLGIWNIAYLIVSVYRGLNTQILPSVSDLVLDVYFSIMLLLLRKHNAKG